MKIIRKWRLKKDALEAYEKEGWPSIEEMMLQIKAKNPSYRRAKDQLTLLRNGLLVPEDVMEAFHRTYKGSNPGTKLFIDQSIEEIAELKPIVQTRRPGDEGWGRLTAWYWNWRKFLIREATYEKMPCYFTCTSAAECRFAAEMMMDCAGRLAEGDRNNSLHPAEARKMQKQSCIEASTNSHNGYRRWWISIRIQSCFAL